MFDTSTLAQVASVISDEYGVGVRVSGSTAYTCRDDKTNKWIINVPALNVNENYIDTMRGYIDHEAGHVRFSDMDVLKRVVSNDTWFVKSAFNTLEDVYVEKKMARSFPGCARNLRVAADILFARDYQVPDDLVESMLDYLLFKARYDVNKASVFSKPVSLLSSALPDEIKTIADDALHKIRVTPMNTASNAQLASELYEELCSLLKRLNDQNEVPKDQQPTDSQEDNGSSNELGEGGTREDGTGEDGTGDAEDSLDDADGLGDSNLRSENLDTSSAAGSGAGSGDVDLDKVSNMIASLTSMKRDVKGEHHQSYDVTERVNGKMAEMTDGEEYESYRLYRRKPNVMTIDNADRLNARLSVMDDVREPLKESVKLSSQLAGLLQTMVMNRGGFATRGRIDSRRLARLSVGRSDIFSSRVEKKGIDTEVILAVDGSGSMQGSKEDCTSNAMYSVIRALKLIQGVRSMAFLYAGHTIQHIIKFDQAFSNKIPFKIHSSGGTPTGEAMYHAIGKFSAGKNSRRILIVMTDGEPDDTSYFRAAIRTAKRIGIEVIGIGIEDDYIKHDMSPEDSFVIQKLDELTPLLFSLLRNKLVKIS